MHRAGSIRLHINEDINVADCTDVCEKHYTNRQATVPYNIESFRLLFSHRFDLILFKDANFK